MPRAPESPPTSLASVFAEPIPADLRDHILSWARAAAARLRLLGLEASPIAVVEARARRDVVFCEGRAPRREHEGRNDGPSDREEGRDRASLALSITARDLEVALRVPPGGSQGLRSYLATPERSLALTTALESLPEQFMLGLVRPAGAGSAVEDGHVPACRAAIDAIRGLVEVAIRQEAIIWLGWVVPRDLALAHAHLIDEQLEDALIALGSVFTTVTSGPSDRSPSARVPATAEKPRRDHARADEDGRAEAKRRVARQRERDRHREARPERDAPSDAALDGDLGPPRASSHSHGNAATSAGPRRHLVRASLAARGPLEKGARVRVLDGPFTGKVGVVQELDGKDGARVLLGLLAVRLDLNDLARCVDGRDRPVLSSSHRKPLPARS